jgi:hypothetical protein
VRYFAAILWSITAFAQAPDKSSVEGTVVNSLTGEPVDAGTYRLTASRSGYSEQSKHSSMLTLEKGQTLKEISVKLAPQGVITGRMLDAEGDLLPAQGAPAGELTIVVNPNAGVIEGKGHFILKDVGPGDYKIYAWEDIENGAEQDPDFMKPHQSDGQTLHIKERSHETVQLKAIPAPENTAQ